MRLLQYLQWLTDNMWDTVFGQKSEHFTQSNIVKY